MNWDIARGQWQQFKGMVKENWGRLTDDDLARVQGDRDRLAGRIRERYGIAREEAHRQIDEWLKSF